MIAVNDKTIIYLVVHANSAAGGTESMHQLYFNLKEMGYNAFMYYKPANIPDPVHETYKKYQVEVARRIDDSADNILIVAEILTFFLYRFKRIRKVIFWLSVDNYYGWLNVRDRFWIKRFAKQVLGYNKFFIIEQPSTHIKNLFHISQSIYAIKHLQIRGISNVAYMPDYIHESFINTEVSFDSNDRNNVIAYNPAKGLEFTKKLMSVITDISWVPLVNLNPEEVVATLLKSKVYIDFGNHPGKDRFPREAALLGCCIVTNRQGSASYNEDVNIPPDYKFNEDNFEAIILCIKKCIQEYDMVIKEFEIYRKFILDHRNVLKQQISKVFKN